MTDVVVGCGALLGIFFFTVELLPIWYFDRPIRSQTIEMK